MPLPRFVLSSDPDRPSLRERAGAILLTIAIHILLLLLLLWMTPDIARRLPDALSLATFDVPGPTGGHRAEAKGDRSHQEKKAQAPKVAPPTPTPPQVKTTETPQPQPQVEAPSFIQLSSADFAASDIGKMARRSGGTSGAGKDSSSVYGPGEGPGGAQLFNAEWYREPTNAELSGYLPGDSARNGFGLIACQTIERYHVDNCRVLGESPLGSGLGQAVRRAAWQFLVVPPRVNGKPQLGAWVRIRIDYRQGVLRP